MRTADVRFIVVHCSATPPSADVDAREIDRWHRKRGFLRIGYHYVIKRDGTVETGREPSAVGAHAEGFNSKSLGICLAGGVAERTHVPENNFTDAQFHALRALLRDLRHQGYDHAEILGHRDLPNVKKACPSFDVRSWWAKAQPKT